MERILVLENDHQMYDGTQETLDHLMEKHPDWQIKYVFGAKYRDQSEMREHLAWCTAIFADTTLLDHSQNLSMIQMLAKIPTKREVWIMHDQLKKTLDRFMEPEDYYSIRHHRVYEVARGPWNNFQMFPIDINTDAEIYAEAKNKERQKKLDCLNKTTGREVRIGKIVANGSEWSKLTPGLIVAEIDCSTIDPNPSRGIWVAGLTEPVKIINEGDVIEYLFVTELSQDDLISEIFKNIRHKSPSTRDALAVTALLSFVEQEGCWDVATDILDAFDKPRRGMRTGLNSILENHFNK